MNNGKYTWVAVGGLLAVSLLAGLGLLRSSHPQNTTPPPSSNSSPAPTTPQPTVTSPPQYVYPLRDYDQRLTVRRFGTYVTTADRQALPCGASFIGYHDADDLEVTKAELNQPVKVHAIAAGIVREVAAVSGYGGLIVIQHTLGGRIVTANYGHINLATATVKQGDIVTPDEVIADLGDQCAPSSGGERKHLHFALHKGDAIDVRGYVVTRSALSAWIDPKQELESLGAVQP